MTALDPALPDAEELLSVFLRNQPELVEAIPHATDGVRVYTALPREPTWPLVRLTLVAGVPVLSRPLVLDNPTIQIESYGGTKKQAHTIVELVRRLIAVRVEGVHDDLGVVTGYRFGNKHYLPDDSYKPSRPRYVADVRLYTRPLTGNAGS